MKWNLNNLKKLGWGVNWACSEIQGGPLCSNSHLSFLLGTNPKYPVPDTSKLTKAVKAGHHGTIHTTKWRCFLLHLPVAQAFHPATLPALRSPRTCRSALCPLGGAAVSASSRPAFLERFPLWIVLIKWVSFWVSWSILNSTAVSDCGVLLQEWRYSVSQKITGEAFLAQSLLFEKIWLNFSRLSLLNCEMALVMHPFFTEQELACGTVF